MKTGAKPKKYVHDKICADKVCPLFGVRFNIYLIFKVNNCLIYFNKMIPTKVSLIPLGLNALDVETVVRQPQMSPLWALVNLPQNPPGGNV